MLPCPSHDPFNPPGSPFAETVSPPYAGVRCRARRHRARRGRVQTQSRATPAPGRIPHHLCTCGRRRTRPGQRVSGCWVYSPFTVTRDLQIPSSSPGPQIPLLPDLQMLAWVACVLARLRRCPSSWIRPALAVAQARGRVQREGSGQAQRGPILGGCALWKGGRHLKRRGHQG